MAKNKKRGFFSWLGLGREEPTPQEEIKETLEEQQPTADQGTDADAFVTTEAQRRAEEIVEVTAAVARQQAEPQSDTEPESGVKTPPQPEPLPPRGEADPQQQVERLPEEVAGVTSPPEEERLSEGAVGINPAPEETPQAEVVVERLPQAQEAEVPSIEIAPEEPVAVTSASTESVPDAMEQERPTKEGFFARLKRSLVKTRQNLGSGFIGLFRGKKIDDDLFEELEEQLLIADVGVETTRRIISNLTNQANRKQLRDAEALYGLLKQEMSAILAKVDAPLEVSGKTPFVILMVGVNGVGKTTTIGKLARQYQAEGKSVMLAAGDTFRAAAVEQLQVWGQRNNIPVIAQHTGADSASVIFDAIQASKARNVDVLIADTAGRLQNKSHLMEELKKITRVMKKLDEQAPHEVMLTIDASTGQNAISQTKLFHEAVGLTGITLTKLDGTAKGGVIFSVADQFSIPIRYIGVGEGIEDLRQFKADDFIEALFARED